MSAALDLFYFSRKNPAPDYATRFLVAGVIEAEDEAAARAALDSVLAKSRTTSAEFTFANLRTIERGATRLLAITLGGE